MSKNLNKATADIPSNDLQIWFLLQLKPNCAQIAMRNLGRQEFETFLPMEIVTKVIRGKLTETRRPLFPGYMFISFDPGQGLWRSINATFGVIKLVSFGKAPAVVPSALVQSLQQRCSPHGTILPPDDLMPGDQVRVQTGPFASLAAEVLAIQPDQRVWVLMDLLGGQSKVAVSAEQLRRA